MKTQRNVVTRWRRSSPSTGTGGQCVEVASLPARWRKSSLSDNTGGQCIEVASIGPVVGEGWRKSSRSTDTGGACVEVADLASAVAVRDSKDPDGPKLVFGAVAWQSFASSVKGGELDLT